MIYELCCSVYQSLEMHDKNVGRNKSLDIKDTTMFHIIEADNLHNAIVSFCEKYYDEIKQLSYQDELYFYQLENGKIVEV